MIPRIGRYEILQELGRGAMGAVYKARDPQIGRTVAIKQILTANFAPDELAEYRQRFKREAQTAGQMSHPGIVTIFDIAEDDEGHPFLVMEFVEGVTLHKRLAPAADGKLTDRLPLNEALEICVQVADALDYAHKRNVVHRDIKPANVLVTPENRIKIADFGIAKFTDSEATSTGHVMGTPSYMSPEQIRGGATDARSDIFSLGAMLYWITTGTKPFPGDTLTTVSFQVVFQEPAPPRALDPSLPEDLEIILSRCLAKKPEERYAAARDVMRDLQLLREGKPITTTRAPAESTVEETLTISRPKVADLEGVTLEELRAAAAKRGPSSHATTGKSPWQSRALIAGAAVIVLIVAAWFLWPRTDTPGPQSDATASAPVSATPASQAPPTGTAPSPQSQEPLPASTLSASQAAAAVASVAFGIECNHNFREAQLEIFADGKKFLDEKLEGKGGFMRSTRGTLRANSKLPAGEHTFKVRVVSERDKYDETQEVTEKLASGVPKTLVIEFGRGSGLGKARKLNLTFREETAPKEDSSKQK